MPRFSKRIVLGAALALLPVAASAAALTIVDVSAPAINCVYSPTCTITVTDSIGNFTPPGDSDGGRLQTRTFTGAAGTPAAGLGGYEYRLDLTGAKGLTAANCVTRLKMKFGPDVKMPYSPKGLFDIYVVTSGGLGSVEPTSAVSSAGSILLIFATPVCPGQTSYFIGLTSKSTTPQPGMATLYYSLGGTATTEDRTP